MDYWFDLTQMNAVTLPIITTADPLQSTRMHLTVYVPEPSSLAALGLALAGLGGRFLRRKRA